MDLESPLHSACCRVRTAKNDLGSLQLSDRALENRNLGDRIAGGFQFGPDLVFEIGGITDAVNKQVQEPFGRKQAVGFEFFNGLVADRHVSASQMEHYIVEPALADPFKT